ncbi:MAG: RHS repeat domain-containing protein, partial [Armatimonadota bacterium]
NNYQAVTLRQMPIDEKPNAFGFLDKPLALSSWAASTIQTDGFDDSGAGPASVFSIEPGTGIVEASSGTDIAARNSLGAAVSFERTYRTSLGFAGLSSAGLPSGWTHNWDVEAVPDQTAAYGAIYLVYPNGGWDLLIPVLDTSGQPTGAVNAPSGAPYVATVSYGASNTVPVSLTLSLGGNAKQIFNPIGNVLYLKQAVGSNNRALNFLYESGSTRLSSIENDDSNVSKSPLLTLSYSNGALSTVEAPQMSRKVFYAYTNGQLTAVSKEQPSSSTGFSATAWTYGYLTINQKSILNSSQTVGGATAGSWPASAQATVYYNTYTGRPWKLKDSAGRSRVYQYEDVGNTATISALDRDATDPSDVANPTNKSVSTFDDLGRTVKVTDAANSETTYVYSIDNPAVTLSVTEPLTGLSKLTFDGSHNGNVTKSEPSDGTQTEVSYAYSSAFPHGQITNITAKGRSTHPVDSSTDITYYKDSTKGYFGKIQTVTVPGSTGSLTTTYTYTDLGNIKTVTYPTAIDTTTPLAYAVVTYGYGSDESVGPTSVKSQMGTPNVSGQPDTLVERTTTYTYDPVTGNLLSATDPVGRTTTLSYNALDQLTQVMYPPAPGDTNGTSLNYVYAEVGKPATSVIMEDKYGAAFRTVNLGTTSEWSPSNVTGSIRQSSQLNDAESRLKSVTNGNGAVPFSYGHDDANKKETSTAAGVLTTAQNDAHG